MSELIEALTAFSENPSQENAQTVSQALAGAGYAGASNISLKPNGWVHAELPEDALMCNPSTGEVVIVGR